MTPSKRAKKHYHPDRFIPDRLSMDMDISHFNLTSSEKTLGPSSKNYKSCLVETLFEGSQPSKSATCKILSFKTKAPSPSRLESTKIRKLYSQNQNVQKGPKEVSSTRKIPAQPERVLDAPNIRDDYYCNLLDWSGHNVLAVALDDTLYLWNATSGQIDELFQLREDHITSVSWVGDGSSLAVGTLIKCRLLWVSSVHHHLNKTLFFIIIIIIIPQ